MTVSLQKGELAHDINKMRENVHFVSEVVLNNIVELFSLQTLHNLRGCIDLLEVLLAEAKLFSGDKEQLLATGRRYMRVRARNPIPARPLSGLRNEQQL